MNERSARVAIPRIIYGTAWKMAATATCVSAALRCGYRGIDTACQPKHYDEAGVGAGVAESLAAGLGRADLYLQTKFTSVSGQDPNSIPYDASAPLADQVAQSCAVSLRNLRTDYVDCVLLHAPLPSTRKTHAVWRALETVVEGGGARSLGISNCYDLEALSALVDFARVKPRVLQNRFYAETGYDREIREFCRGRAITYQSFWTLSANPHLLAHETLVRIAEKHRRTPAQVLFRFLTQREVVPLTGTRSAAQLREDLQIFEFELGQGELAAVDAILER